MSDPVTDSGQTAPITIQRGARGEEPRIENYDVPWRAGMSVLDAVVWIRTHVDSSLAFRYSCVNANACKECMVLVNGKTEYACTARLSAEGTVVGPLTNKTLIRDLVTDIVPPKESLRVIMKEKSTKG
jgi:succinate dehydrogenase/fumarate reductase-like Fe-S protein